MKKLVFSFRAVLALQSKALFIPKSFGPNREVMFPAVDWKLREAFVQENSRRPRKKWSKPNQNRNKKEQ